MAVSFLKHAGAERWFSAPKKHAYILAGTDLVAISELKNGLIRRFGGEDPLGLSRTEYDIASVAPAEFRDALRELGLFASQRVIVAKNAEKLLDPKKYPELVDDIKAIDEMTLLIMIMDAPAKKIAENPLVEFCLKEGAAAYCYAPSGDEEAAGWVMSYCARKKIAIDRAAARAIVAMVGSDTSELAPEIEKTAFACDMTIDEAAVAEYLAPHREDPVFDWADSVLAGEKKAIALVESVTDRGKMAVTAIAALYSRFEEIEGAARGGNVWPRRRDIVFGFMAKWTEQNRDKARAQLLEHDLLMKSRPEEQKTALMELLTLRLIEMRS